MTQINRVTRASALAALALATGLGACSVGDAYSRPDTPVPAAWTLPPDPAAVAWPTSSWWRQFGSPALDALMEQAEHNNFDLGAAIARVRQAEAQARIAGAPLLPSLDAGGGTSHQHGTGTGSSGAGPNGVTTTSYTANLTASYEVDFWGKNAAGLESAQATAQASRFDRETVALTMQSSIANSYFDLLGTQDRLQVARDNVKNADDVLAAIRDRVHFGTATDLDLAQQESVAAGLRAAIPPLEQQLRQDVNALALLAGQLPEKTTIPAGTLASVTLPMVAPGLPSELLGRRPDVRNAEAQLVAANADMTAARAALFPDVTLTAETGFESLALATLLHGSNLLYSLAANFTQPIFHGDALRGAIEAKQGRYEELVQDYRKAVVSAFTDVENALIATRKTAEEEDAQKIAVTTAQRAFDISKAQFNAGLVDITTLLNTQRTLFSADDALVQAKLGHIQAVVSLFKALGGGWSGTTV
jgi:NodT family efflux transporter outer membrane factor (OMF) lipoprotein